MNTVQTLSLVPGPSSQGRWLGREGGAGTGELHTLGSPAGSVPAVTYSPADLPPPRPDSQT